MKNTKILKSNKGITLIALVITIIVLIILAGIAISLAVGNNGIMNNAQNANMEHVHAKVYEALKIAGNNYVIDTSVDSNTSYNSFDEYLCDNQMAKSIDGTFSWQIDVEKLLGSKQSYGNGDMETNLKDSYALIESYDDSFDGDSISDGNDYIAEPGFDGDDITMDVPEYTVYELIYYSSNATDINDYSSIGKLKFANNIDSSTLIPGEPELILGP